MKSICIDARMLDSGGIGTYLKNLIRLFSSAPFKMAALVNPHQLERLGQWQHLEPIAVKAPIYSFSEQSELPFKIPKCDLFWSPHYNIPLFPIRAKRRLTTIHDVYHLAYYDVLRPLEKIYAKVVIEAAVRFSDAIITDSYFSESELKKYTSVSKTKLNVIHLGVDQALFQMTSGKEMPRLPQNFILFVGNLKPHKNLKAVVKALHLLDQQGCSHMDLVVIGKSEGLKTKEDLDSLLISYPHLKHRLHFLGSVCDAELAYAYRSAQAFVLPSFYEGFGFPPLEAMVSGCPTIVSHCGSLPEICKEAALYIDPQDPQEIADALKRVFVDSNLREELKRKGFEQSSTFSWVRCAERHLELIEQLVGS